MADFRGLAEITAVRDADNVFHDGKIHSASFLQLLMEPDNSILQEGKRIVSDVSDGIITFGDNCSYKVQLDFRHGFFYNMTRKQK